MSFLDHLDELRRRIIWASPHSPSALQSHSSSSDRFWFHRLANEAAPAAGPTDGLYGSARSVHAAGLNCADCRRHHRLTRGFNADLVVRRAGLYSHEKKWAIPFIALPTFFFIAGAAFSHYVVFPIVWQFFAHFTTDYLTFMPRVEPAFSMYPG